MLSSFRFHVISATVFISSILLYHFYPKTEAYELIEPKSHLDTPVMNSLGYKQVRLRLSNGIGVWLISAPEIESSAIGVAVGVGGCDDPLTSMGLSHFCEHMVFLGSEAFPEMEGNDAFKAKHNGNHNAYTDGHRTVYGLSCASDAWKEAVERMGSMLKAPLMKEEALQRERNAVNEEFEYRSSSDGFIAYSIIQDQSSADHPFHKFLCGNHETLANVTSQELKAWVKKYYRGGNMSVYAISSLPLEEMIPTIEKAFSSIDRGTVETTKWPELFEASQTHKQIWADVRADRSLFFIWSLPSFSSFDSSMFFLQKAISHPYEGGLQEAFKQKGWINACEVAGSDLGLHNLFCINLGLTEKGVEEIDQVKAFTYDYLNFLQTAPWPQVWLTEYQNIQHINWQMHVNDPTLHEALNYAAMTHKESLETFPDQTYWPTLDSFLQAQEAVKRLSAASCIEIVLCPQTSWPQSIQDKTAQPENWATAPWIGTRYLKLEASESAAKLKQAWSLPSANSLFPIGVDFSPSSSKDEFSYQAFASDKGSIKVFNNPSEASSRDSLSWLFRPYTRLQDEPSAIDSKQCWSILAALLNEKLQTLAFESNAAGQSFAIFPKKDGLLIELTGYSSSVQNHLLADFSQAIQSLIPSSEAFEYVHQNLCNQYEVLMHEGPLDLLLAYLSATCLEEAATPQMNLKALKAVSFDHFQTWLKKTKQLPIQQDLLVVSSRPMNDWTASFTAISEPETAKPLEGLKALKDLPFQSAWKSPLAAAHAYSHVRDGILRLQVWPSVPLTSNEGLEDFYCLQMLDPDFHKEAFLSLRTEQQLGYVVQSKVTFIGDKPALLLLVLSSAYDQAHLQQAMHRFSEGFAESLHLLSDEAFASMKQQLILKLKEPSRSSSQQLQQLTNMIWKMGLDPTKTEDYLVLANKITKERYIERMLKFLGQEPLSLVLSPASEVSKN